MILTHPSLCSASPPPSLGVNLVQDHMNPMPSNPVFVLPHFQSHQLENGQTREFLSRWLTVPFFFFFRGLVPHFHFGAVTFYKMARQNSHEFYYAPASTTVQMVCVCI